MGAGHDAVGGKAVLLVEVVGEVGGLAELALEAEGFGAVGDAGLGEGVGELGAHAPDGLVVLDGDEAALGGLDGGADGFEVGAVDEGVIDDGGEDAAGGELFAGGDGVADEGAAGDDDEVFAFAQDLGFTPGVGGMWGPGEGVVFAADEEDDRFAVASAAAVFGVASEGEVHEGFGFVGAGGGDDEGMGDGAEGGEVGSGLVGRAVGGVLEAGVGEDGDHGCLGEGRHGEGEVAFGDAELGEGIDDGDEAGFGEADGGADHVGLGDADFDPAVGEGFLEEADAGGALDVGGDGEDGEACLGGAEGGFGEAGLDFVLLGSGGGRGVGGFGLFGGLALFPIGAEGLGPAEELLWGLAAVDFGDELDDFLAVREGEAVAAGGAVLGGLDAVAFDGFDVEADGAVGLGAGGVDGGDEGLVDGLEVVAVGDGEDVPAEGGEGGEGGGHAEGVLADAAGEFGVVIGEDQDEGVQAAAGGEAWDGGEGFLGFALHGGAVGDDAEGDAVVVAESIAEGEALGLGEGGAEGAVAEEDAFGVEVGFAVAGEFALEAAEAFEGVEGEAVVAVVGAEGIEAVFSVAGVVDVMEGLMPGAALGLEHEAVDSGVDFGEGGGPAPVAGGAAVDGVDVHEGHEGAGGAGVGEEDIAVLGVSDADGVARGLGGGGRQAGPQGKGREGRRGERFNGRFVFSHKSGARLFVRA